MKWDYFYGKKYSDGITGIELYTDSFYYYSEGDAFFEIREDYSLSASAPYAKTYYKKDDIRIYSYIDLWYMAGPAQNNMDIIKGENKITGRKEELYLPLMENTYIQFIRITKNMLLVK